MKKTGKIGAHADLKFAIDEFYRVLSLAIADRLPGGKSDYRKLMAKSKGKDVPLFELLQERITAEVAAWPEWAAVVQQPVSPPSKATGSKEAPFHRYSSLHPQTKAPTQFQDFNHRFRETLKEMLKQTKQGIAKAISYSLKRFEMHPDYRNAVSHLQGLIDERKLEGYQEFLPLLDVWTPTRLEKDVISTVLSRIKREMDEVERTAYPYDTARNVSWNLAMMLRVQVQVKSTFSSQFSKLTAAAESQYDRLIFHEILNGQVVPCLRDILYNPDTIEKVVLSAGSKRT